ncbi:hypothetical protein CAEBREN_20892 [Caenorhabditis brenneri]|uniref:Uncharacterized protein n=1 Tax=Caenorhabditis brenneri TaxID=135651 RepID=G0NMD1_CAEBE|nr:hypothetical protein CAEBREN_20892 [Caenorhabditis brenneri]
MFTKLFILFTLVFVYVLAAPLTEQQALNILRVTGMSESGVNSFIKLDNQFKQEYPYVAGNKETKDKFMADFAVRAQNVVNSLTPQDQAVYYNYAKIYG